MEILKQLFFGSLWIAGIVFAWSIIGTLVDQRVAQKKARGFQEEFLNKVLGELEDEE